ncbi:MAG: VWA domain-containing protein [Leptospirillia bacterium]
MSFLLPEWLPWLPLMVLLTGAGLLAGGRRLRRDARRYAHAGASANADQWLPPRSVLRAGLGMTALLALGVALAGPLYGEKTVRLAPRGADVVIALDISLSMAAEDIKPSRLDHARRRIAALLESLPGHRAGLVLFAGDAVPSVPLTLDHQALGLFLDAVVPGMAPAAGSSLQSAVDAAAELLEEDAGGAVVVFSDGEATAGDLGRAVTHAKKAGARVFTFGVGGVSGAPIPMREDDGRLLGYKRDRQGKVVQSRLEGEGLARLALETGGTYHVSSLEGDEIDRVAEAVKAMAKGELDAGGLARPENRYQWPLALAVLLLLAEMLIPAGGRERTV